MADHATSTGDLAFDTTQPATLTITDPTAFKAILLDGVDLLTVQHRLARAEAYLAKMGLTWDGEDYTA